VAHARTSRFGTGGSEYAGTSDRAFVDTVQCGVYRRSVLESAGCFDESMEYGEDDELNWRLRERGWRILLDTRIRFHYITRPTLRSLYRQYYRYGMAKVRVGAAHPRQLRPWHLAPVGFVATLAAVGVAAPFSARARRAGAGLVGTYLAAAVTSAVSTPASRDLRSLARVVACFPAMHCGYGLGMLSAGPRSGRLKSAMAVAARTRRSSASERRST
jgi:hypothetical protein